MKKATFFVTLIMLLLLVGCGKKDSSANEEVELLRQEVAELKASMETLNAEPTATIVQEEPTVVEEEPEAVKESEEPKVHRTLSSQTSSSSYVSSNTTLSCGYAASFFSLTDELKDINTRESAKENPYVLPYPGKGAYRDIWFYLTGETVEAVYNVNENWERVEELQFEEANGATGFFYNMKYGAGDYFFEIVTSQNSYFIGVRY